MKICLINPPLNMRDRFWYPIGISYVASHLLHNGYDVEIIDCIGDNLTRTQFKKRLEGCDTNIFGIGGLIMAFNNIVEISSMIKEIHPNSFIFAGNTCASTIPNVLMSNSNIQSCVLWEGEQTAVNLVDAVSNNKPLNKVKGITYKDKDNKIHSTSPQPVISNLDVLHLPAWHLVPMRNYLLNTGGVYPISTVRGCPYHCTFCLHLFMNNGTRFRSAKNIISEMVTVKETFDVKNFIFMDDLFVFNKKMVLEFCRLKKKNSLIADVPFNCTGRANLVNEELLKVLKDAGCEKIGFGFESMHQEVLDWYNKKQTVKQIKDVTELMKKHDVKLAPSWLIGAANETVESVKVTSDFCKDNNLVYNPHFVTPYPMTPLYDYAIRNNLIDDELGYIKLFSKIGSTNVLTVNFTKFRDEELVELKNSMAHFPNNTQFLSKIPNAFNLIKKRGFNQTFLELLKYIKPDIFQKEECNIWK